MAEYIKQANQERLVIYQIETPEVINDVEAIAEMERLDAEVKTQTAGGQGYSFLIG